jgi:hypothetical protein
MTKDKLGSKTNIDKIESIKKNHSKKAQARRLRSMSLSLGVK